MKDGIEVITRDPEIMELLKQVTEQNRIILEMNKTLFEYISHPIVYITDNKSKAK